MSTIKPTKKEKELKKLVSKWLKENDYGFGETRIVIRDNKVKHIYFIYGYTGEELDK